MSEGRRYRILGVLGKGGFGTVYRAELLGEGGFTRQVALKVLNPEMAGMEDVAARMRDEARLLGLLRHRAILQVDGLVKLEDRWTIVMEYIEGADLQRVVRKAGPVPLGPALEIVGEVAGALHIAYTWPSTDGAPMRLLHRDIKPPNILLTGAGETKVLDFGIARADFGGREAMTRSVLYGSVGYMAPERLDFEELPEGDVYALGAVLFELLDGNPFGKASIHPDKHKAAVADALGRIRAKSPGFPDEAAELLGAMLAYDPEERPSAREVERRCRTLRTQIPGVFLRDWAEQKVPALVIDTSELGSDQFSGSILIESSTSVVDGGGFDTVGDHPPEPAGATIPFPEDSGAVAVEPRPRRSWLWAALGSMGCLGVGGIALAVVVVVVVIAVAVVVLQRDAGGDYVGGGNDGGIAEAPDGPKRGGGQKADLEEAPSASELSAPELSTMITSELTEPWTTWGIDVGPGNVMYATEDILNVQYGEYDRRKLVLYYAKQFHELGWKRGFFMKAGGAVTMELKKGELALYLSATKQDGFALVSMSVIDNS